MTIAPKSPCGHFNTLKNKLLLQPNWQKKHVRSLVPIIPAALFISEKKKRSRRDHPLCRWFITAGATMAALPSFFSCFLFPKKSFHAAASSSIHLFYLAPACQLPCSAKKQSVFLVCRVQPRWNHQWREALACRPTAAAGEISGSDSPHPESACGGNNVEQETAAVHGLQRNRPSFIPHDFMKKN